MKQYRTRAFYYLLAPIAAAVALYGIVFTHEREPEYQGENLTQWLTNYEVGDAALPATFGNFYIGNFYVGRDKVPADFAVRQMGTNALPPLLKMLQAHESAMHKTWLAFRSSLHLSTEQKFISKHQAIRAQAVFGIQALGHDATPAIPKLIELLMNGKEEAGHSAALALGSLGTNGSVAVPALLAIAKDANRSEKCRNNAITALRLIDPEASHNAGLDQSGLNLFW